jgi:hypothetical protein
MKNAIVLLGRVVYTAMLCAAVRQTLKDKSDDRERERTSSLTSLSLEP